MDGVQPQAPRLSTRPAAKPPSGLSAAALERRMGLKRRAREDAARNLPPPDAVDLSEAERAVVEAVATERAKLDAARHQAKADAETRLRALAPTPQDFTGPALDARLALKQIAGRVEHDWKSARQHATQAHDDLVAFKQANRLRRVAVYPRSGLLQAGLLLCAAVFESLFSAALFAEDDARGLLGGAITAIGLSGANVTLGFLAGFLGLRYLQHVRPIPKSLGALAFAAFSFLALMLNLFAADWRDRLAAMASPQPISDDASFHLWSLLQLSSPQAIILLMLGAGVWVFAAMKGYSGFDDPYPDHGKMDRAREAADHALSAVRGDGRETLEAPIDAARTAVAARIEKMRSEFETMNKAFDAAAVRMEALDAQARALDDAATEAIHIYRQENAAARSTPAPSYFSTTPPSAGPSLDALASCSQMIDVARAQLAEAKQQSTRALEELVAELDETTKRLDAAGGA
jgi:hypothetical protein